MVPYVTGRMEFIKYIRSAALKRNEEVKCIPRYKALRIKTSCGATEKNNPSIESSERIPFGKKKICDKQLLPLISIFNPWSVQQFLVKS